MSHQFKPLTGANVTVGMMTSGGLAPCLSASVSLLTKYWVQAYREGKITGLKLVFYKSGYKGLLTGDSFVLPESDWDKCESLLYLGGSPIGNSRVKVSPKRLRRPKDSFACLACPPPPNQLPQ
jgi:pyrophosphate--fructose-6-phosphate 1-phosphotransferase